MKYEDFTDFYIYYSKEVNSIHREWFNFEINQLQGMKRVEQLMGLCIANLSLYKQLPKADKQEFEIIMRLIWKE